MTAAPDPGFGVYVHIPFCRMRCDYCAFATYSDRDHLMDRYVDACLGQLERAHLRPATSVFFGGGTPSRLDPRAIARILHAIECAPDAEVTIECNPEDVTEEALATFRAAGVTRISLGVQSTNSAVLASLGRQHDPAHALRAAHLVAHAGFASWSMDLIVGAAAERDEDWERSLTEVVACGPPHVSVYALSVEPGTPLATEPERFPDDDVQARRYCVTDGLLSAEGYHWEEISNWAKPGHECRHHRLYWAQGDYVGVGSGAHSHESGTRWWNIRTPERFIEAIEQERSAVAGREVLTDEQRAFEALTLALRTPVGVPDHALAPDPLLDRLVVRRQGRCVLTLEGRLLANEVSARLVVAAPVSSAP